MRAMAGTRWVWSCALLLLLGATAASFEHQQMQETDALFSAKVQETKRLFLGVEAQLKTAQQVTDLFGLENAQLELLALETRAQMDVIRDEVQREMGEALQSVERTRSEALANVTRWRNTLQGLKTATDRNRRVLQQIRDEKEMQRKKQELELLEKLQMEKEEQEALERKRLQELETLRELEKLQEVERRKKEEVEKQWELEMLQNQEMEKQRGLEKLQELEKRQKLEEQNVLEQKKHEDSSEEVERPREKEAQNGVGGDAAVHRLESGERVGAVKRLLARYVEVEQTVVGAVAAIYRHLVLPVIAILGVFLLLTVTIAKYNAAKQARRNRRVLYSGYPKSYRPKAKQETNPVLIDDADPRPRVRHPMFRGDPNGLSGAGS